MPCQSVAKPGTLYQWVSPGLKRQTAHASLNDVGETKEWLCQIR